MEFIILSNVIIFSTQVYMMQILELNQIEFLYIMKINMYVVLN